MHLCWCALRSCTKSFSNSSTSTVAALAANRRHHPTTPAAHALELVQPTAATTSITIAAAPNPLMSRVVQISSSRTSTATPTTNCQLRAIASVPADPYACTGPSTPRTMGASQLAQRTFNSSNASVRHTPLDEQALGDRRWRYRCPRHCRQRHAPSTGTRHCPAQQPLHHVTSEHASRHHARTNTGTSTLTEAVI